MKAPPVLAALAARYRTSAAGRTGQTVKDFTIDYRDLLKAALATDGEALIAAEADLRAAAATSNGMLSLDTHPRDEKLALRVRLAREGGEAWLFQRLGEVSPSQHRQRLAAAFEEAATRIVPEPWQSRWTAWCQDLAKAALVGEPIGAFARDDLALNQELLQTLAAVLAWPGESLIRFASCVITGHSKRLEELTARLEQSLEQLSGGAVGSLEQFGLLQNPRTVLIHGPLRLHSETGLVDTGLLRGPVRLSELDLRSAVSVTTAAKRCLTIENETTFHELAKLQSGILLVHTSYPGSAVRALFERLPENVECWHFGDTDPVGFDILRDLRERTERVIRPLHMRFRDDPLSALLSQDDKRLIHRLIANPSLSDVRTELEAMLAAGRKGRFEQESLGWPECEWPFY